MLNLSLQDKLALTFTGAKSMRAMAREMGITHQKLGRYLREGQREDIADDSGNYEPGEERKARLIGIKKIPDSAAVLINNIFDKHVEIARETAISQGIPFSEDVPAFQERRNLSTGNLGDRVFVNQANFIRPELRAAFFSSAVESEKYFEGGVRSIVDFIIYATKIVDNEIAKGKRFIEGGQAAIDAIVANMNAKERKLEVNSDIRYLQTRSEAMLPGLDSKLVANAIEKQLRAKHETAAHGKGTALAESFILQLLPANYEPAKPKQGKPGRARKPSKASKAHTRGRGAK